MNPYSFYGYATDPISRLPVNFPVRQVAPGFASASDIAFPAQGVSGYITTTPAAMRPSPAPIVGQNGAQFLTASASALPTAHAAPSPAVMPPGSKEDSPENAWVRLAMAAGIGLTGMGGALMAHRLWKQRKASATTPSASPTPAPTPEQKKAPSPSLPAADSKLSDQKAIPGPKQPPPKTPQPASGQKAVPTPEPATPKAPQPVQPQKQSASAPKADAMEPATEERFRTFKNRLAELTEEQQTLVQNHFKQLPEEHQIARLAHLSQLSPEQWNGWLAHMAAQARPGFPERVAAHAIYPVLTHLQYNGLVWDGLQGAKRLPGKKLEGLLEILKGGHWLRRAPFSLLIAHGISKLPESAQVAIGKHLLHVGQSAPVVAPLIGLSPSSFAARHGIALLVSDENLIEKGIGKIGLKSEKLLKAQKYLQWVANRIPLFLSNCVVSDSLLKLLPVAVMGGAGMHAPRLLAAGLTLGWHYIPERIAPLKDALQCYGQFSSIINPSDFISRLSKWPRLESILRVPAAYGARALFRKAFSLRRS